MNRHYQDLAFFVWLREKVFKIDKPYALGWGEWDQWYKDIRAKKPVAFWLTEKLPDILEKPAEWFIDPIYSVKYYIVNRWVDQTHAMVSKLPRGQWHEFDERLLHSMFDELVDFVEIEKAWSHVVWDKEAREKYQAPWYSFGWFRTRTWRCTEAGLAHLEWEKNLRWTENELSEGNEKIGQLTHQAETAREIHELYLWWKEKRPARGESWDVTGFQDFWNSMDAKYDEPGGEKTSWMSFKKSGKTLTKEEDAEYWRLNKAVDQQEEDWAKEDEDMMIRLIKIRKSLWN